MRRKQTDYPVMDEADESGQFYQSEAVRVHVVSSSAEPVDLVAAEYGSCTEFNPIAQVGVASQPTQLLQRRLRRTKAVIVIRSITAGNIYLSSNRESLMSTNPPTNVFRLVLGASNTNSFFPIWENQQPLYAISSVADTSVSVMDQSYGEPEPKK